MKAFNKVFCAVILLFVVIFIGSNIFMNNAQKVEGRPYRVEIARLSEKIKADGLESIDISKCEYVTAIVMQSDNFYTAESDYVIRNIDGTLYRFDYVSKNVNTKSALILNISLLVALIITIAIMLYIRFKILKPFHKLTDVPYELSKGNLTTPLKQAKNSFFRRFIWGVDLLRENMEEQKLRELELVRERKVLLLSLSHDIKTPLSAIKLYSKALSRGLYESKEKQNEIALNIGQKADEIEGYVSQIIQASRDDIITPDVIMGEFYLRSLMDKIESYYSEKLRLINIEFTVEKYSDCILMGDMERCEEVLQNILENAIKYGDAGFIRISFSYEENCLLITVKNSGNTLPDNEFDHIFDSFFRGTNTDNKPGSGLGLYICKTLMNKMGGEIFASKADGCMAFTVVIKKA